MSVRCERAWAPYEQKSILTMAVARKLFHPSDLELLEWDFGKFGNSIPGYRYGASKETVHSLDSAHFLSFVPQVKSLI